MKYMFIAGEASGDLHASHLISAVRELDPDADIRFFGGDLMAKAARRSPDLHYDRMNVMGFSEVLRKLPSIFGNLRKARQLVDSFRPDILVLVDYPGFNLKLAAYAHRKGIRTAYFISPKVWAWKEYRVRKIKKYVDAMYSILPFEVPFYRRHGYKVTYVGNPSVQEMDYALSHLPPVKHFIERQGLGDDDRPIIALLPGSRKGEIRNNLHLMIEAAKRFPDFRYVVAAAPSVPERFYREVAQDPGLPVVFGCTPTLLKYSKAALVTSGTATLETALIGTPQVVCYRANGRKISYKIMEKLLKVKYVSLPNLIVGNQVVPELLVHHCTVDAIARELSSLLQNSPQREWQVNSYKAMRRKLGTSIASRFAAELIVDEAKAATSPEPAPAAEQGEEKGEERRQRRRPRRRPEGDRPTKEDERKDETPAEASSDERRQRRSRQRPAKASDQAGATPKQTEKDDDAPKARKPRRPRRPRNEEDADRKPDGNGVKAAEAGNAAKEAPKAEAGTESDDRQQRRRPYRRRRQADAPQEADE